jgi:hypothetical protein
MLSAGLQAFQMAMIACDKDYAAPLIASDLGKGKTILASRQGYIDHRDIVIVLVEGLSHLGARLDLCETVTLVVEHVSEQIPDAVVVFYDQNFANPRHFAPRLLL